MFYSVMCFDPRGMERHKSSEGRLGQEEGRKEPRDSRLCGLMGDEMEK